MASVGKLEINIIEFEEAIERRDLLAELTKHLYFIAARRIQAWIRGILTRNHIRLLHSSAVTIQRHWRGYRARIAFDRYLIECVHQMWQDHYDKMATVIQALWRGYWIRKTVLDVQKMRRWLEDVYLKNEETVENMNRFRQAEIDNMQKVMEQESMQWILYILFKLHHLLRTAQRTGVITRIDKTQFTLIEEMLKCFQYKHYVRYKRIKPRKKCRDCVLDKKPTFILKGTYYERCEKEIQAIERSLEAGQLSLRRSEPYEKQEKNLHQVNHMRVRVALEEKYTTAATPLCVVETKPEQQEEVSPLRKEFEQKLRCFKENELCEKIKKMDCHLDHLRLRCPIHNPTCSK